MFKLKYRLMLSVIFHHGFLPEWKLSKEKKAEVALMGIIRH